MTEYSAPPANYPPPVGPPVVSDPPPAKPRFVKKHVIGYLVTGLIGIAIGAASANDTPVAPVVGVPATVTETVSGATHTVEAPATTVTVTAAAPAPVKPAPAPAPAAVTFPGDGTYQVGVDIKAGTYVSPKPDSGNCYWARLKSDGGGFEDIIANNNSAGQSVVTIKTTDKFFETSGCNDWKRR